MKSIHGQIVEIVPERRDKGEGGERYVVTEDNGDRCFIAPLFGAWGIIPTELVSRTDIQVVKL